MSKFKNILFFLLVASLAGCSPQPIPQKKQGSELKQALRINLKQEPQTLDPRKVRNSNDITVVRMLFEGLTRVNGENIPELALAESMRVSEDLRTYTFTLKESVWSNGDRVTAFDFVHAWRAVLDPAFPSDMAFQLYLLKGGKEAKEGKCLPEEIGVKALSESVLEVNLVEPTPYFLELLAFPTFFPVNHQVDQDSPSWSQQVESYVSNGPFVLKSWKHQDQLQVQKNEKYWDVSHVNLQEISLCMVEEQTELQMFEKNQLDWAGSPITSLPVDSVESLKKQHLLNVHESLGTYLIRVQTERFPFNHPLMRRALALAINREELVSHILKAGQTVATGLVPLSLGLQSTPYFKDGSVEEARELFVQALEALHLKRENFPQITLLYQSNDRGHVMGQAIQQQWFDAFGIRVKLEAAESKIYFNRISMQDYDLAIGSWIADFRDPINFLEIFKEKRGGSNNTLWENSRYQHLLERSKVTSNSEERLDLLRQSEKILMNEMPVIPIFYYSLAYLKSPLVHNVILTGIGGLDFKTASVQDGKKEGEMK